MTTDNNSFAYWAVLEVFGHEKYAGFVSTAKVGDSSMIELTVPDVDKNGVLIPGFTKYINHSSVFSITPVGEEYAKAMAERLTKQPVAGYEHTSIIRGLAEKALQAMVEGKKKELQESDSKTPFDFEGGDDDYDDEDFDNDNGF